MKIFIYHCMAIFFSISCVADTLETKSFTIKIEVNCAEGNVSCDDVSYTGIRKSDGSSINLHGKTLNRETSHSLYGYSFTNGQYEYIIFTQDAEIIIQKNNITIASEKGKWLHKD